MIKEPPAQKRYAQVRKLHKQGYSPVQIGIEMKKSTNWVYKVLNGKIGKGK